MTRGRRTLAVAASLALAGGVVAGCGDDEKAADRPAGSSTGQPGQTAPADSGGPAKAAAKVAIKDFKYLPASVTVTQGGKVTWTNSDTAQHNAENGSEQGAPSKFTTKTPLEKGDADTVTFTKPGSYKYYCVYHRFMEADVIVK